jgi:hypothetical protein
MSDLDDVTDSEDEFMDSDNGLDDDLKAKADTFLSQIVEILADKCIQQVFDKNNMK